MKGVCRIGGRVSQISIRLHYSKAIISSRSSTLIEFASESSCLARLGRNLRLAAADVFLYSFGSQPLEVPSINQTCAPGGVYWND